ncbi:hypothetical protein [Nocardia sp. NBC_00511]|uniref:hypothetical protein n=1 Tax=Nocardia sp. NBC_00511 TaxID=2903591 RepID=UPI0030DEDD29
MSLRLMTGLGAAALLGTAAGVLAPEAAAKDLAPGLSCRNGSCVNDTDDAYRVQIRVSCLNIIDTHILPIRVNPHTTTRVPATCDSHWTPGPLRPGPSTMNPDGTWTTGPMTTGPDTWQPGTVTSIDFLSATVDNGRGDMPPTGS